VRHAIAVLTLLTLCAAAWHADAGTVFDRVKARGAVQCGSFERPGLAQQDDDRHWSGLNVDVCRAIAVAVLGSAEKIAFHGYATPPELALLSQGGDDVSFLTGREIAENDLSGRIVPGPPVFVESHAVMVPAKAKERTLAELAGDGGICFMSGSPVEHSLPAYFGALNKPWRPVPYSEDGEMIDAYNVQQCHAIAYELTTLATVFQDRGVNRMSSRILAEPLVVYPVIAATGTADAQWSALVAWTVDSLIVADRPDTRWVVGGVKSMPAPLRELGLDKEWQTRVVAAIGTYRDIFDRNLGAKSSLKLSRDADRISRGGLSFPFIE